MAGAKEPMPAGQRCTIWVLTVVACAVAAVSLPIKLEHKSAEEVFISGEFVLAGCLIVLAGIGDLLCWMLNGKITFFVLILLFGCIVVACGSAVVYASFTGEEGGSVTQEDYIWAIGTFALASAGGASAVYQAASG
ncbi:hypothetical protein [Streptomyces sp. NPDC091259]|uniref:hypothetical protein n=1 Tax=Streptomyces sp. NPDC091259 TaxID=3365976 RepID=UPI00380F461C